VEDSIKNFIIVFTSILYEALPYIVAGAVIAGIVEELIPQRVLLKFIPRNRFLAIAVGGLLGLPSPMCDCAILVVVRRLLRKGVPLSSCVCLLLAGPIVNVLVMLSTWDAFRNADIDAAGRPTYQFGGFQMMALRIGLGYLVAFGTSLVVEWQYRKHGAAKLLTPIAVPPDKMELEKQNEANGAPPRSVMERLDSITEVALHDFVDVTVFLIFGALLAALARQIIPGEELKVFCLAHPTAAIGIMMALAVLLCICSQADAFIAASFINLPPASKLAFLLLGPMLDLKLYMMYTRVFRYRLIWTIMGSVIIQVLVYSLIVHFIWQGYVSSQTSLSP